MIEPLKLKKICKKYGIGNIYLKKILEIGKFSNKINEECLTEDNPILWYLLGIISSDGHNGKFNEVDIFQKDGTYLNNLKKLLNHQGTLYKNGEGYVLRLNSPKLTELLNSKNQTLNDCVIKTRNRIDELENRVTKLEEKGDTVQRKTKHRRIVIKL